MEAHESLLYGASVILMIVFIWCVSSQEGYQTSRDEHEDLREDPANLLREDTLWEQSADDNIFDPDGLYNIYDSQNVTHTKQYLDDQQKRTHLMQQPASDYMGQFAYNKHNIYNGEHMEYPSYKSGGYYLSPSYEMPPEDKFDAVRRGMNYYNFDHVDPLLRQIESGLSDKENFDNIGGDITPDRSVVHVTPDRTIMPRGLSAVMHDGKEHLSSYTRAHVGTARVNGDHAYMHINDDFKEDGDGYSYQDYDTFYDEKNYNNSSDRINTYSSSIITSGPRSNPPEEVRNEDLLTNEPVRAGGMSQINMLSGVEEEILNDTNRNWYNVTNVGYNLDLQNGAYGIPLSNEMNDSDIKDSQDKYKYDRMGKHDVSPASLNWDDTYTTGSENFMGSRNPSRGYRTELVLPGALADSRSLEKKSFIEDISIAQTQDLDIMNVPFEGHLWHDKMRLDSVPDHVLPQA